MADALTHPGRRRRAGVQRVRLPLDDPPTAAWTSSSPTCTTTAASSARSGSPGWRTRRACSARRTCRARASASSTWPTSPRACPTRPRSTSSRGTPTSPSRSDDLVAQVRERHDPRPLRPRLRHHDRPGVRPRVGEGRIGLIQGRTVPEVPALPTTFVIVWPTSFPYTRPHTRAGQPYAMTRTGLSMSVTILCGCGRRLNVTGVAPGKRGRCPSCGGDGPGAGCPDRPPDPVEEDEWNWQGTYDLNRVTPPEAGRAAVPSEDAIDGDDDPSATRVPDRGWRVELGRDL